MAGVEVVVGLAIGVVPLLVSAIEHYDDVLRPFVTYRKFTSKAQRFHDGLEMERTIFRTECHLLLAAVADRGLAAEMLNDPHHPSWKDIAVCERFGRQLGSLGTTFASLLSKMVSSLEGLSEKSQEFNAVIAQPKEGTTFGDRDWRHRVGTKLKFSFSELGLRQCMADLRKLNKTFLTLSNQIVRLRNQSSLEVSDAERRLPLEKMNREMKKLQMVQKASRQLYEALDRADAFHTDHLAHFCLEARCINLGHELTSCQIRFNVAFTNENSSGEPSPTSSGELPPTAAGFRTSEKEILSRVTCKHAHVGTPATKDNSTAPCSMSIGDLEWFEIESVMGDDDTALRRNACPTDICVGVLNQNGPFKHFIYRPPPSVPPRFAEQSISLANLIARKSGKGPVGEMPQFQRLHLAKSLTLAVLQFHTTPWLMRSWQSDNIEFFEVTGPGPGQRQAPSSSSSSSSSPPHLNVRVLQIGQIADSSRGMLPFPTTTTIAPNPLLFNLGVMLLELAYGAPFHSLTQSEDLEASPDAGVADYVAARRLADEVGTSLGIGFASIVRKCLRCDFGSGEDLDDIVLQTRLYEDVVCKLEDLEEGFRKLQLGI